MDEQYSQPPQPQAPLPGYQPPPVQPTQYPPAASASRNTTTVIVIAAVAAVLMLCCAASCGAFFLLRASSASYKPWSLSTDQKKVAAAFGPPQTFSMYFGDDPKDAALGNGKMPQHRIEIWDYYALGSRLTFRDGKIVRRDTCPQLPRGAQCPALKPEEFNANMSLKQVSTAVGAGPDAAAAISPEVAKDTEAYSFHQQVVATFEKGKLVAVVTMPVALAEVKK